MAFEYDPHQETAEPSPCPNSPLTKETLSTLTKRYTLLSEALWDVADPLLVHYVDDNARPRFSHLGDPADEGYSEDSLGEVLVLMQSAVWIIRKFSRRVSSFESSVDTMLDGGLPTIFAIWIHTKNDELKERTRRLILITLSQDRIDGSQPTVRARMVLKKALERRVTSQSDVQNQLIKRLRVGSPNIKTNVDAEVLECVTLFQAESTIQIHDSGDRSLLWYSIAAFRRIWCNSSVVRGHSNNFVPEALQEPGLAYISKYICSVFDSEKTKSSGGTKRPFIPELWCHEILHVNACIIIVVTLLCGTRSLADMPSYLAELIDRNLLVIRGLRTMLRYYARHPSRADSLRWISRFPAPASVVRFSRMVWSRVQDTFYKQRVPSDWTFAPIFWAWKDLGDALTEIEQGVSSASSAPLDFSLIERCAHGDCACSVFKTFHSLKVCQGCSMVAYCNRICQKRDWANHRNSCNRGRPTRN